MNEISRDRGGRPVRWLGDGGMFHFREPRTAVVVSEETAQRSAGDGLRFRPLGTVGLKGVARPLPLHQALRG